MVAAGVDKLVNSAVTLGEGQANWDWVQSFRQYVGIHQETRTGIELSEHENSLLWPAVEGQNVDLNNLQKLHFSGSVHWTHHGGVLDVTLANPTIDFTTRRLLIDGASVGTLANPGVAINKKQTALLELPDLKAEVKDGYLLVTSFQPKITHFSDELVGFYEGESREPFVATIRINDVVGERPAPILWELFPDQYGHLRPRGLEPADPNFQDAEVSMEPALAKCIRWELDIDNPGQPIMKSHLARLTSLSCAGVKTPEEEKIRSLDGLQFAPRLVRVNLRQQRIQDLSPLRDHPKLTELDIAENNLTEINGLGYLPSLTNLNAENNNLVTISQVATLSNLETLNLDNNKLSDLRSLPYEKLTLNELRVSGNHIEDLSPLADYRALRILDLSNNNITHIDALKNIRGLREIDLSNNFIETIAPLQEHARRDVLEKLKVADNRLTERAELEAFGNRITDVPATGEIPQNKREKPGATSEPSTSASVVTSSAEPSTSASAEPSAEPSTTKSIEPSSTAPSAAPTTEPTTSASAEPGSSSPTTKRFVAVVAAVLGLLGGIGSAVLHVPWLRALITQLFRI